MNRNLTMSSMMLAALLVVGCGSDPKPEPNVGNGPMTGPAPANTQANANDGNQNADGVGVDDRIAKMCDLTTSYFDFDSANVSPQARGVLDKIASCFKDGAGKDQNLNIVGHADPRGETEYNFALGQRRAGAIAGYLTKAGLAETRIETSSRGELEASGTDTQTWAKDRKVEILLAD
ncbi:MAG: OmpA family protein [Polyangiaceae bacterium]